MTYRFESCPDYKKKLYKKFGKLKNVSYFCIVELEKSSLKIKQGNTHSLGRGRKHYILKWCYAISYSRKVPCPVFFKNIGFWFRDAAHLC